MDGGKKEVRRVASLTGVMKEWLCPCSKGMLIERPANTGRAHCGQDVVQTDTVDRLTTNLVSHLPLEEVGEIGVGGGRWGLVGMR